MLSSFDTSKIIKESNGTKESKNIYYVPGYFRLKVKNFTEMNLDNLDAEFNGTIVFSIYYGDLDKKIVGKLENSIILLFGRDDAIKLTE
jgi:hypothetical protein